MTVAPHPASHRRSLSPSSRAPEHKSDALATSRRSSSTAANAKPAHRRRPKRLAFVAAAVTTARRRAARRRMRSVRDLQIPIGAPHQTAPFLPAVSSLGGFRTPAPGGSPNRRARGRRPKPFSIAVVDRIVPLGLPLRSQEINQVNTPSSPDPMDCAARRCSKVSLPTVRFRPR